MAGNYVYIRCMLCVFVQTVLHLTNNTTIKIKLYSFRVHTCYLQQIKIQTFSCLNSTPTKISYTKFVDKLIRSYYRLAHQLLC
jgi:hypothetical protein